MVAQRVKQLRDWMTQRQLDAYVIPHSDRYQSEYLTPNEERLQWLSGFTGSNGMAIVTRDKAALLTDSRYTLQAPKQIDTKIFSVVEVPPAKPTAWLAQHVSSGAKIGLDPWLLTVNQAKTWQKAASDHNWTLDWLPDNPIDTLWIDKPLAQVNMASAHLLKHAGKSKDEKIESLLKKISEKAERILITDPGLVCWLLNIRGRDVAHNPFLHAQALVARDGHVTLFTETKKITDKLRNLLGNSVTIESLDQMFAVLRLNKNTLQLDPARCPKAVYDSCVQHDIPLIEVDDPASLLRACKNWVEIKGAQTAHEKDKVAFKRFLTWFAKRDFAGEDISELDVVAKLHECRARDEDFVDDSFASIAGYGPNGAIVHYKPEAATNLDLRPGNLLLLDSGGQYYAGTTDVTRVLAVGKPTLQMKKHYTAVLKGLIALSSTRFPKGTTGAQLDAIARRPIWAIGLDYGHGTGHGVGSFLSVHEGPQRISAAGHTPLEPGMILSIEPGIYLEGQYGIRLENLVVVIKDKLASDKKTMYAFQTLTKIPFDKTLIDWPALSEDERLFLADFSTKP